MSTLLEHIAVLVKRRDHIRPDLNNGNDFLLWDDTEFKTNALLLCATHLEELIALSTPAALPAQAMGEKLDGGEVWERVQRVLCRPDAKKRTGEELGEAIMLSLGISLSAPQEAGKAESQDAWPDYIAGIIETYVKQNRTDEDREKGIAGIIRRRMYLAPKEASKVEPVADWGNRRTDSLEGWINELRTLADHRESMPGFVRHAMRTIASGLHRHAHPTQQALSADMFWDYDDGERYGNDIDEIVADYGPGEIVKIDCAKRLPSIKVRVIVDPSDPDALTYEEIPAILAAAGGSEQ